MYNWFRFFTTSGTEDTSRYHSGEKSIHRKINSTLLILADLYHCQIFFITEREQLDKIFEVNTLFACLDFTNYFLVDISENEMKCERFFIDIFSQCFQTFFSGSLSQLEVFPGVYIHGFTLVLLGHLFSGFLKGISF